MLQRQVSIEAFLVWLERVSRPFVVFRRQPQRLRSHPRAPIVKDDHEVQLQCE